MSPGSLNANVPVKNNRYESRHWLNGRLKHYYEVMIITLYSIFDGIIFVKFGANKELNEIQKERKNTIG